MGDLEKRLAEALKHEAEALEQQTATAEILRVISASPSDVSPVFRAIVRSATRLCDATFGTVFRFDGELITVAANQDLTPEEIAITNTVFPAPATRGIAAGRAIVDRAVVHISDIRNDPDYVAKAPVSGLGYRTALAVPMLKEGSPIGVFVMWRREVRPFTDEQIELVKTFADQAVIAIENVRLFTELQDKNRALTTAHARVTEALDQQTATSEILRVISSSPTDLQPVFDTIVRNAARVCGAFDAVVVMVLADSEEYVQRAHYGPITAALGARYPLRGTVNGRAILEARVIHVENLAEASDYSVGRATAQEVGYRTMLSVPLLRDGVAIGAIGIRRTEVLPFSDEQIALLKTFADQAVIAIENVRLFTELEARNRELTEAMEQQTATAGILNVISRSPTNIQPVFDAILESAVRLCETAFGAIFRFDGERLHLVGHHGIPPEGVEAYRQAYPMAPQPEMHISRAIRERRVVYVPDILAEPQITYTGSAQEAIGYRSLLMVPMLRDGQPVGVVGVGDRAPGGLSNKHVTLVRTFADQAVIAIENVRLFNELESANRELEAASQHKSEFLANMSHELRTPLNAILGFSEILTERMFGDLNAKQEEYLKDIHASGQHLLSLINDILDLSKIEAGRMELELTDFHLPTAIDNALILVRERAARRGIVLGSTLERSLGTIRADERKVKQVLLNLLSNALKFTPEGGRIELRAIPAEGSVEISVSDTGVGIAPEDQEAIFEEFRQVGTADKKVEGTGLGLALSRKFIELHGGRIWVQSQVGIGSAFSFTLPVLRADQVIE